MYDDIFSNKCLSINTFSPEETNHLYIITYFMILQYIFLSLFFFSLVEDEVDMIGSIVYLEFSIQAN